MYPIQNKFWMRRERVGKGIENQFKLHTDKLFSVREFGVVMTKNILNTALITLHLIRKVNI